MWAVQLIYFKQTKTRKAVFEKKKIFAVVGLGNISRRHRKNLKLLFPSAQVAALASSNRQLDNLPESCDILTKSLDELLALNPDFVIIASPATFHAKHAIPFIKNNIPVLIEKPIAANLQDSKKIENAITKSKTPVGVGYCLRYKPFIDDVKRCLDNEGIGKILTVDISCSSYLPDWRPSKNYLSSVSASADLGGGALLELSHEIDYARLLLNPINFKSAAIQNSQIFNIDVEDSADLIFTTPGGGSLNIHLDFCSKLSSRYANFYGTKGKILWDLQNNKLDIITRNDTKNYFIDSWDSNQMYIDMVNDFLVNFIHHKESRICSVLEAVNVLESIDQAKKFKERDINE